MSMFLEGDAHVWLVWTDLCLDAALIRRCEKVLEPEEKERYRRFRFDRDRRLYLVSHTMLRRVLSTYTGVAPADLRFERNAYGRPELAADLECEPLRFNLSHTRGLAACVVSRRLDCGIDVESAVGPCNIDAVANSALSLAERIRLERVPEEDRRLELLRFWTLKEAYVKARGMGMSLAMDKCVVKSCGAIPDIELEPELGDEARGWQFYQCFPTRQYSLAVALRHGSEEKARILLKEVHPETF